MQFFLLFQNPQAEAAEAADLPPKYDIVMGFDIPPPAYDTLVIDNEKLHYDLVKCPKESAIQHIQEFGDLFNYWRFYIS